MNGEDELNRTSEAEYLPAEENGTVINAQIAALINEFTERPDLFLGELEKHDPGFTKRMNERTESFANKTRESRFNFGRIQAYTALAVSVIIALSLMGIVFYLAKQDALNFWNIIALAIFFAISQSGASGFLAIANAIKELFSKTPSEDK